MLFCTPTLGKQGSQSICGAMNSLPSAVQDVDVDHCGTPILVAEEFLDSSDVVAIFQQPPVFTGST